MNTMVMLVKREFWEHRSLWIAPLILVGLLLVVTVWGTVAASRGHHSVTFTSAATVDDIRGMSPQDRDELREAIAMPEERKQSVYAFSMAGLTGVISALVSIVVFFYLLDCLFAERKDRSILFWKSLPVSDAQVVLSKLAVAMVVVPVGVVLLAAVTQVFMSTVVWLRFHGTVIGELIPDWSFVTWFKSLFVSLVIVLGGVLWYAPIAGYLLVMSAWARRNVFLWAVLPLVALPLLEWWMLGSTNVAHFLGRRFTGFVTTLHLDPNVFSHQSGNTQMPKINEIFDALDVSGMFTHPEMWLGLLAAALLVAVTIRLRRYRDDT